jgi:hypothetical protein
MASITGLRQRLEFFGTIHHASMHTLVEVHNSALCLEADLVPVSGAVGPSGQLTTRPRRWRFDITHRRANIRLLCSIDLLDNLRTWVERWHISKSGPDQCFEH